MPECEVKTQKLYESMEIHKLIGIFAAFSFFRAFCAANSTKMSVQVLFTSLEARSRMISKTSINRIRCIVAFEK